MKRIRFTSTERYESEGRNQGPLYKEGSTHDFEDDFADRWLRRGVAVEVNARTPLDRNDDDDGAERDIPDYARMTKAELMTRAEMLGIEIEEGSTRTVILEKICAFRSGVADLMESAELPNNVMQLRKIAKDEELDLGDARTADELKDAILKARAAKAERTD